MSKRNRKRNRKSKSSATQVAKVDQQEVEEYSNLLLPPKNAECKQDVNNTTSNKQRKRRNSKVKASFRSKNLDYNEKAYPNIHKPFSPHNTSQYLVNRFATIPNLSNFELNFDAYRSSPGGTMFDEQLNDN